MDRFILLLFLLLQLVCLSRCLFIGRSVIRVRDGISIDLGEALAQQRQQTCLLVLGTYAADFNAIEYCQRLRHYLPSLKDKGVNKFSLILNASPSACISLAKQLDIPTEVEIYSDSTGSVGKEYGVSLGWRPDDSEMSPYLKLFGMLLGLGAWATLPSVISGYIGNPWQEQPWIESSLAQGQVAGRWPNTALELEPTEQTGPGSSIKIKTNQFDTLPLGLGKWGRRPLELATLRLQNMIGVSLKDWSTLKPTDDELKAGILTQLGGCMVLGPGDKVLYEWKDQGICHVANFEDILKKL